MNLKEAQEQKSQINKIIKENFVESYGSSSYNPFPGIGIHPITNKDEFKIAIHLAHKSQEHLVDHVLKKVNKDSVDVQVTGIAYAYSFSSDSSHPHSIEIGASISRIEANSPAGTLGCFVRKIENPSDLLILSCSHVFYNLMTQAGSIGDPIIFSALRTSGSSDEHQIASLDSCDDEFIKAIYIGSSGDPDLYVDAAIAKVTCSYSHGIINQIHNNYYLQGYRQLESLIETLSSIGEDYLVFKIGQKTGLTYGLIKEFNFQRQINYGMTENGTINQFCFNNLITIEGSDDKPFSQRGDSGSLIYDNDGYAVALLVGGTGEGGRNNKGITYALPIDRVLNRLNIKLAAYSES